VYLGQFGWVAFEPTPGRGRPGAEPYTGVPEAQADVRAPTVATTAPPTTATTAPAGTTGTTRPRDSSVDTGGGSGGLVPGRRANPVVNAVVGIGLVVLLWCLSVPLLLSRRRARRRAAADTDVARVVVSWTEACEDLAVLGAGAAARRPGETVHEYAARAPAAAGFGPSGPEADALAALAGSTAVASYSPGSLPAETVANAVAAAAVVHHAVDRQLGWRRRLLWRLDPRPLFPQRIREITGKSGSKRAA
jgi:hypothetical protein